MSATTPALRKVVRVSRQGRLTVRVVEDRPANVFGAARLELTVIAPDGRQHIHQERWSLIPDSELDRCSELLLYKGVGFCVGIANGEA